jgi:hypothetical protein
MSGDKNIDKTITVKFSVNDVKKMLIDKTGIDNNLADLIVGHITQTLSGCEQLTKALLGIFPQPKYKKGDFVYVPVKCLPGWKVNKEETLNLKICKESCVMVQIEEVYIYASDPYKVTGTAVLLDGKIGEVAFSITDDEISFVVDDPVELLEIIDDLKRPLPF